METIRTASAAEKNFVVSPSGLAAAEYLKKTFGTPYEVCCPYLPETLEKELGSLTGKKVLVIHQQFAGNEIRKRVGKNVIVSSFFRMEKEWMEPGDIQFSGEEAFLEHFANEKYDAQHGTDARNDEYDGNDERYISRRDGRIWRRKHAGSGSAVRSGRHHGSLWFHAGSFRSVPLRRNINCLMLLLS